MFKKALFVLAVLSLACFSVVSEAAAELSVSRAAIGLASAFADTFTVVAGPVGTRPDRLPSAYLFFSRDGSTFTVQRWFTAGVPETVPIPIPASSSLMIPAPPVLVVGNLYRHVFLVGGTTAATDSVIVIPFDR